MAVLDDKRAEVLPGRWRDALLVALAAAGVAAAIWWLVTRVGSVELSVGSGSEAREIGLVSVVVTAFMVTMAAAGLLRMLQRRTGHALAIWGWVSAAVLALSLVGPLGASTLSAGLCLVGLHLAVAAVAIGGLRARFAGRVAWAS
jgi:hypothetical protein